MKIFRNLRPPKRLPPPVVVGIGAFDGVHRGHQKVLERIRRRAGRRGTAAVITFVPHPRRVTKRAGEENLTTLPQRLEIFRRAGIRVCWVLDFDRKFARQSPRRFAREVLDRRLRVGRVCVGEGFRFGRGRRGDLRLLKEIGRGSGFEVEPIPSVRVDGARVSSSRIRRLVKRGEMENVSRCLGREYALTGTVVAGRKLGGELGYPTANFFPEQLRPAAGVYAARIELKGRGGGGMAYLGCRPTFYSGRGGPALAEAHMFGFRGSLYGRRIKVFLKKKIRGDIKFTGAAALRKRIRRDEREIRRILAPTTANQSPDDSGKPPLPRRIK